MLFRRRPRAAMRPTRHLPCLRCGARTTEETARARRLSDGLGYCDARCTSCGHRWRNLYGSLRPVHEARRKWLG